MSSAPLTEGLYAERYRIDAVLGRGGMGSVMRVHDTQTGATLALKRLNIPKGSAGAERRIGLFQREYHILTQLDHPNVVRAFDYGVCDDGPYYTMELIEGQSLRELAPLPWRKVCEHLSELCSALAVLHARGFIHRDLTPSNLLIDAQGMAKLIDFGAMAPVGPNDAAVGTPAYMAPEALELSMLDARADIYSLGALAYWALTARHAYPAPSLASLPDYWRQPPPPASHFCPDTPPALDQLIAAMLSLSQEARPDQLAEVTQRLSQLLGRETPVVAALQLEAHLATPKLAGRTAELKLAAGFAARAKAGEGALLMLSGEPGMGRSRLVEAFALEAKLAGCLTLHVQASAGQPSRLAVIESLIASAQRQAPLRAGTAVEPLSAALAEVWPREDASSAPVAPRITRELQQTVVSFFERLQALGPLALCVDDVHLADVTSVQILAQLAHGAHPRILVVCSAAHASAAEPAPLVKLRELAEDVPVRALEPSETSALLASMLGEIAGLEALASWVQRVSEGRPQTCVELASHLLARGALAFENGRFRLTAPLTELDLPRGLEDVLMARWLGLSEKARLLVSTLALCMSVSAPRAELLLQIVAKHSGERRAYDAFTELLGQRVIKVDREYCSFTNPRLAALVLAETPQASQHALARDLGEAYFALGEDGLGFAAQYYRLAGDMARASAVLLEVDSTKAEADAPLALLARSPRGQRMYEELLAYCKEQHAPPIKLFRFRKVLLQLAAVDAPELTRYAPETLAQLRYDIGLDQWEAFADTSDAMARLVRCFQLADQRYKSSDASQRGLEPSVALKELATCVALLVGAYSPIYETVGMAALPGSIEPLRGLAPVLEVVYLLALVSFESTVRGCFRVDLRQEVVRRLSEPVAGMDRITQNGAYLLSKFYMELELALRGAESAQAVADELEQHPMYAVLGKQLLLVAALSRGDFDATRRAREERELLALQSTFTDQHRETSVRWEAIASYRAADLLGVKQLLQSQALRAERFPGARPLVIALEAQYHLLTEEPERALSEARAGQKLALPLQHACWRELALLEMEALAALGRFAEVGACAERVHATLHSVDYDARYEDRLIIAEARGLAAAGALDRAKARIRAALHDFEAVGPNGVAVAALYESLAELALLELDANGFLAALAEVQRIYQRGKHPGLVARYERLNRAGRRALALSQHTSKVRVDPVTTGAGHADEQLRQLLAIVLDEAAAESGYLFYWSDSRGLRQLAQRGAAQANPVLEAKLTDYVRGLLGEELEAMTVTVSAAERCWITADGSPYVPIALRDYEDPSMVVGLVAIGADQPVQLGRGLLGMLSQTLKVLVSEPS